MATILTKKKDTTGAPSAGDLTNSTGGAELAVNTADKRLYTKDSGGNVVEVGINPTSITTGTLNTSGAVVFNDAGADVDFRVEGDTDANLLFVDASADRLGMGTNAPTARLHVEGATNLSSRGVFTNTSSGTKTAAIGGNRDTSNCPFVGSTTNDAFAFVTNDTERMRIDSSGNVGIGTTSPSRKLDVVATNEIAIQTTRTTTSTNSVQTIKNAIAETSADMVDGFGTLELHQIKDSAGVANSIGYYGFVRNGADNSGAFYVSTYNTGSATERMRITSGGYLKASPNASYNNSSGGYHELNQNANDTVIIMSATNGSFSDTSQRIRITRSASSAFAFLGCESGNGIDDEFRLRGDGNAYADGSWNGSGADYAEYFESASGEAIPRGTTVVLENNKVRAATADDPVSSIIGVVRPKEFGKGSMVVGNLAWNMWTDKYITDDFGVYEMEDHDVLEWEETVTDEEGNTSTKPHSYESHAIPEGVTVPADATRKTHDENGKKFQHRKLNPNYDPAAEYTPREERPEWLIIGLLGQVPVLKGQPVGDRWVKMRDISETVEEWFIR